MSYSPRMTNRGCAPVQPTFPTVTCQLASLLRPYLWVPPGQIGQISRRRDNGADAHAASDLYASTTSGRLRTLSFNLSFLISQFIRIITVAINTLRNEAPDLVHY